MQEDTKQPELRAKKGKLRKRDKRRKLWLSKGPRPFGLTEKIR